MGEQPVCVCRAVVNEFKSGKWERKGGYSRMDLVPDSGGFRILGREMKTKEVTMNMSLFSDIKYEVVQTKFHRFNDESGNVWALQIATDEEGTKWDGCIKDCIGSLGSSDGGPPAPPAAPAAPAAPAVTKAPAIKLGGAGGDRNNLFASIREGRALKTVGPPPERGPDGLPIGESSGGGGGSSAPAAGGGGGGDMMSQMLARSKARQAKAEKKVVKKKKKKSISRAATVRQDTSPVVSGGGGGGGGGVSREEFEAFKKEILDAIEDAKEEILDAL